MLLCYAYLEGSVEIFLLPFPLLFGFFNQRLHASENFHVSEWRRPSVPDGHHSVIKAQPQEGAYWFGFYLFAYGGGGGVLFWFGLV